ncbi:MAG: hypothetical protein GY916_15845 [Gammaproteobacteria bacterium]|nr:hypothetical protein [Gammaproteobacteria bacterium]
MWKTHKQMAIEDDDHAVMDLEIIDQAGDVTAVKARAVNIRHKSDGDILIAASRREDDGKIMVITSSDPDQDRHGRLVTYHNACNLMEIDVQLKKARPRPDRPGSDGAC